MDWLRRLLHPESCPARTARLDARHARDVAALHPEIVQTYRARLEAWDPDRGARRSPATTPDARLQRQLRELGYVDEAGAPSEAH